MTTASDVREVVQCWLDGRLTNVALGLPEYDDRMHQWRVALVSRVNGREPIGEVRVANSNVVFSTNLNLVERRARYVPEELGSQKSPAISFRPIPSRLILGDAAEVLEDYAPGSVQLVFTSPPYFNAKPECHESESYSQYLEMLESVFTACHGILSEGRFLAVNTSPVLIRRANRNVSSRRMPITFDLHSILNRIGFDFMDDIVWQKPEGAGWNLGRGRRFAADRQPMQYKPVTVTENVVVYRKHTDKLIDWNLRYHPDTSALQESLIDDEYERTNVWQIHPTHHRDHPAVFPETLAERIIRYYSIKGDMVLDPFAGTGTTGRVAGRLQRRFMMVDNSTKYFNVQLTDIELRSFAPQVMDYEYFASSV